MAAKDIKNLIIAIIVLLVGIRLLVIIAKGYIPQSSLVPKDLLLSVDALSNLFTLGLVIVLLFAVPFYLSRRSEEKKQKI